MNFEDWWWQLPAVERKLIGYNNGQFVWQEAAKHVASVLTLPSFVISCTGEKVVIMRTGGASAGEGGMFNLKEFDEAVDKFFSERF
jgi:hypothetical protein